MSILMIKKTFTALVILLIVSTTFAQKQSFEINYILSKCEGATPTEFTADILAKTKH